jgi:hypothetical protein
VCPPGTLLRDPGTVRCALSALTTTDGTAHWWPYAAAVGSDHVMVHLAGTQIPEPVEPWSAGPDPHIWIADRGAVGQPPPPDVRPLLIGHTDDKIVFLDAARAPGPITVTGPPDEAGQLYDLLAAQLPEQALSDREIDTTHWPISVGGGTINLVGLPVAFAFSYEDALHAANFMRAVALAAFAERLADPASGWREPQAPYKDSVPCEGSAPHQETVGAAVPEDRVPSRETVDAGYDDSELDVGAWLRSVKDAAETALARKATVTPQPVPPPALTPAPALIPKPLPAPRADDAGRSGDLDDWADTAVSSAHDR